MTKILTSLTLPPLAKPPSDLEVVPEIGKVVIADKPAKPTRRYTDAPLLNLKDLLPSGMECPDAADASLNSTFRATRLEFIILE